jgi:hypothetical protein
LLHQSPTRAHSKVQPRFDQSAVVRVVPVVQDVDAATKGQVAIDHTQLAVQTPPAAGDQQTQSAQWGIHTPVHPGMRKTLAPFGRQIRRAHAIDHHPNAHPPQGGTLQGFGHRGGGTMKVKNVGFDVNLRAGLVHGQNQRLEIGLSAFDQSDLMTVAQKRAVAHVQSIQANSATKGRWSDMRCQMRPDGAMA